MYTSYQNVTAFILRGFIKSYEDTISVRLSYQSMTIEFVSLCRFSDDLARKKFEKFKSVTNACNADIFCSFVYEKQSGF